MVFGLTGQSVRQGRSLHSRQGHKLGSLEPILGVLQCVKWHEITDIQVYIFGACARGCVYAVRKTCVHPCIYTRRRDRQSMHTLKHTSTYTHTHTVCTKAQAELTCDSGRFSKVRADA